MIQTVYLTKDAFTSVVSDLIEIEEGINQINDFFPTQYKEADEIKQVLREYISQINDILRSIFVSETAGNDFPYVIIGSEVVIEDVTSLKTCRYKLVSPFQKKVKYGDEVSFLSPLGKALLLKQVDDNFFVKAPGGEFQYRVLSVKITTRA